MISQEVRAWIDSHDNIEIRKLSQRMSHPTLERMQLLCKYMGDPQELVNSIHVTGTNGKTSTVRMIDSLLAEKGLYTGCISSPHLQSINERICLDTRAVTDEQLDRALMFVRDTEQSFPEVKESSPSYFEILVASAFELFHEEAIDVGLIEVGMGGLYDATNVCNSQVSVVTNVQLDHMMFLGNSREKIAQEKSGIIKEGNRVVIGEADDYIANIFVDKALSVNAVPLRIDDDFAVLSNDQAVGGRLLTLRTPYATYDDIFLPLHGKHQGINALCALTAAESFIDAALGDDIVREGFSRVQSPGRLEVMQHDPLVIIDGAHNIAGAQVLSDSLEDFGAARRIWVIGFMAEKDPEAMVNALGIENDEVVIVASAKSDRAMTTSDLATSVKNAGIESVFDADTITEGIELAQSLALDDDHIIITGSLYLVGEAREVLSRQ